MNATCNSFLRLTVFCCAIATLFFLGCSDGRPKRVPVSGRVLIDGQPLTYGYVQFIPQGARPAGGKLDAEGRFKLTCFDPGDGAVVGSHRITVTAGEFVSQTETRWHAPKKYSNLANSGLEQQITGPVDDLVINLTWAGGKPFIERSEPDSEGLPKSRRNKK